MLRTVGKLDKYDASFWKAKDYDSLVQQVTVVGDRSVHIDELIAKRHLFNPALAHKFVAREDLPVEILKEYAAKPRYSAQILSHLMTTPELFSTAVRTYLTIYDSDPYQLWDQMEARPHLLTFGTLTYFYKCVRKFEVFEPLQRQVNELIIRRSSVMKAVNGL